MCDHATLQLYFLEQLYVVDFFWPRLPLRAAPDSAVCVYSKAVQLVVSLVKHCLEQLHSQCTALPGIRMHEHILYTNHATLLLYLHITTVAPHSVSARHSLKKVYKRGKKLASKIKRDTQPRSFC